MKLTIFSKKITLDENNKGIAMKLNNIGPTIDEVTTLFWYKLREDIKSDEEAAERLRRMNQKEMQACVLQNIRDELRAYDFSQGYEKYV